jgi:hypothetical protein
MEDPAIYENPVDRKTSVIARESIDKEDSMTYEESIGSEDSVTEDDVDEKFPSEQQELCSDEESGYSADSESEDSQNIPTPSPSRFTYIDPEIAPLPQWACIAGPYIEPPQWTSINQGSALSPVQYDDDEVTEQSSECNQEGFGTMSEGGITRASILDAAEKAGIMVSKAQQDYVEALKTPGKRSRTATPAAQGTGVDSRHENSNSPPASKVRVVQHGSGPLPVRLKSDSPESTKLDASNVFESIDDPFAIHASKETPVAVRTPEPTPANTSEMQAQTTLLQPDNQAQLVKQDIVQRLERFNEITQSLEEFSEQIQKDAARAEEEARVIRSHWGDEYVSNDDSGHGLASPGLKHTLNETVVEWMRSGEIDLPEWCGLPSSPPMTPPVTPSKTGRTHPKAAVIVTAPLTQDKRVYCLCRRPDDGERMVECSVPDCTARWYHWKCLTPTEKKMSKAKSWVCSACRLQPQIDLHAAEPVFKALDIKDRASKMLTCAGITKWVEHPYGL